MNAFLQGAGVGEIIWKELCCKSERNMLQIGEKSGGNPANPARREEGVGGNLNFAPNMRETTCQLVAASYPTFCQAQKLPSTATEFHNFRGISSLPRLHHRGGGVGGRSFSGS